jgi:hypothetical protein
MVGEALYFVLWNKIRKKKNYSTILFVYFVKMEKKNDNTWKSAFQYTWYVVQLILGLQICAIDEIDQSL